MRQAYQNSYGHPVPSEEETEALAGKKEGEVDGTIASTYRRVGTGMKMKTPH